MTITKDASLHYCHVQVWIRQNNKGFIVLIDLNIKYCQ